MLRVLEYSVLIQRALKDVSFHTSLRSDEPKCRGLTASKITIFVTFCNAQNLNKWNITFPRTFQICLHYKCYARLLDTASHNSCRSNSIEMKLGRFGLLEVPHNDFSLCETSQRPKCAKFRSDAVISTGVMAIRLIRSKTRMKWHKWKWKEDEPPVVFPMLY